MHTPIHHCCDCLAPFSRPFCHWLTLLLFQIPMCSLHAQQARLDVQVVDQQGQPLPVRAWVRTKEARLYRPLTPESVTPYHPDESFSCDGTFALSVSPGDLQIHIEKGKEYLPLSEELNVSPGQVLQRELRLQRWINMAEQGWFSADLHVHLGHDNVSVLKQLALADDVNLIPSFTYWLRGNEQSWPTSWPDASYLEAIRVDDMHLITRNNIEIERIHASAEPGGSVGATFLFNLQQPLMTDGFGEHFPTDASLCHAARQHSPAAVFDSDKPSWAETVVGAALGQLDTIQLCHNHYNRRRTLDGGWGMIGPLAAGDSNWAAGDGLFHRTNTLYYQLLNCGFRLGVSGGSAIGVMPAPAGFSRLYAKLDGPFSAENMWEAIRAGRTFATTGPMLWLEVDGHQLGDTIELASGGEVDVLARVAAIEPMESLQIVHDGKVVMAKSLRGEVPSPSSESTIDNSLSVMRSGWIAARALYRAPDGLLRQAHTSPIYLEVAGQPVKNIEDARYMLAWIEHLKAVAQQHPEWFPDATNRTALLDVYEEASNVYSTLASSQRQ